MLFLSRIRWNFHRFLRPSNHENLNSVWEWRQNEENHEIVSGAPSGSILGGILADFWHHFGPIWLTLDEKGETQRVPKKIWKKSHAGHASHLRKGGGCPLETTIHNPGPQEGPRAQAGSSDPGSRIQDPKPELFTPLR